MENKEIRRKILEYVYQKNEEIPQIMVKREELLDYLDIKDSKLVNAALYLEEKGYLKLLKSIGSQFVTCQITSYGIDLVENPEGFNQEFPMNITQNIIQDSTGVAIGNNITQTIDINNSFKSIYEDLDRKNPENKKQIKEEVKKIETELKKENINQSKLSKSLTYLKENASWIIPTLLEIIKENIGF